MALRVSASMGRALCGRVTQLQRSGPSWGASKTPRRVHDAGAIQAYLAQEKFAASRRDRPNEVRQIENARHTWAVQPPRTPVQWNALRREESRFARLTRPHRRTLAFCTRKKGTQALEMDNNQAFSVTPDRMSILLGRGKDGFRGPLRRALPENGEVPSFRLVEKRRGRMGVRNRKGASVEYEAHITVQYPEATPVHVPETPLDIVGIEI